VIPKEERDQNLAMKLRAEAAGILSWAVDGLMDWMAGGLPLSGAIEEATRDYREDKDPLGRFLAECTEPDAGGRVESSSLYALFVAWARFHGENEWTQKGWTSAMVDKGVRKTRSDGAKWLGLRMTRAVIDFPDPRASRWQDG
jgi:putative DNA primase/helicase